MITAKAPGRVEILGNHTDYNEGYVLLSTVSLQTTVTGAKIPGNRCFIYSRDLKDRVEFRVDSFRKDSNHPWADYLKGVIQQLQRAGQGLGGFSVEISSAIPFGVGLSSSAALELSFAFFLQGLFGFEISRLELVKLCRRAENEFVGVGCGILDQFSSGFGRKDALLFLDCRDLSYEIIPLPANLSLVICDSGKRRSLISSEYNQRRRECRQALEFFQAKMAGVAALRDVTVADFRRFAPQIQDESIRKRAQHIVFEDERVRAGRDLLKKGELPELGKLMRLSHQSSRDLFENSIPELDFLVECAYRLPGIVGSKLSGAGWGGATVNLVLAEKAETFARGLEDAYQQEFGGQAQTYICSIPDGAGLF